MDVTTAKRRPVLAFPCAHHRTEKTMADSLFSHVTRAMIAQAKCRLAETQRQNRARPVGHQGVSLDFYDRHQADRSIDHIRWAVWLVSWDGTSWKRRRRLSGPGELSETLSKAGQIAKARGLQRVG